MKVKWNKKEATRCIVELRNPFEEIMKPQGNLQDMAAKIKEVAKRTKPQ